MLTTLALAAIGGQDYEALWDEARKPCREMPYASFEIGAGYFGEVRNTTAIVAKDGRTLATIRHELPASRLGGSGRYPMVVVSNYVEHFDGTSLIKYDSLTGSTTVKASASPRDTLYPALTMFWLDLRKQSGWRIVSVTDEERSDWAAKYRRFELAKTGVEATWKIEVRMRDGFVVYDWHGQHGDQLGKGYNNGQYWAQEPRELAWKPPTKGPDGG
jgi:hypothetical protein